MKVKYVIGNFPNGLIVNKLQKEGIISSVAMSGLIIMARYGVNKTTLKKILKRYIDEKM